ncbi:hypothetical protein BDW02DRAFT_581245 [Decorospora gaudefroyi]|uniref:Uncharacterized protein n=1 Tax=Decorospora gaudefroyi TaxID=184978 RepID=A0A6A5K3Z7_9PLEO|nr:hypothetical protein BDW02DRAFT_581245 [Decorospora gaudefroyi]
MGKNARQNRKPTKKARLANKKALKDAPKSVPTTTFHAFPLLPDELKAIIIAYAWHSAYDETNPNHQVTITFNYRYAPKLRRTAPNEDLFKDAPAPESYMVDVPPLPPVARVSKMWHGECIQWHARRQVVTLMMRPDGRPFRVPFRPEYHALTIMVKHRNPCCRTLLACWKMLAPEMRQCVRQMKVGGLALPVDLIFVPKEWSARDLDGFDVENGRWIVEIVGKGGS